MNSLVLVLIKLKPNLFIPNYYFYEKEWCCHHKHYAQTVFFPKHKSTIATYHFDVL